MFCGTCKSHLQCLIVTYKPHVVIIPPPPNFTLGTMQSDKYRSPGNHQSQTHLSDATHSFANVCREQSACLSAYFYTPMAMELIGTPDFNYLDGWPNTFGNIVYITIRAEGKPRRNVKMRLPSSCSPSTTSSKTFLKVLYIDSICSQSSMLAVWLTDASG